MRHGIGETLQLRIITFRYKGRFAAGLLSFFHICLSLEQVEQQFMTASQSAFNSKAAIEMLLLVIGAG